jgi:hypothetical protein
VPMTVTAIPAAATATATPTIPTVTPSPVATWLTTIAGLENAREWALAGQKADAALQDPALTVAQVTEIAHHAVADWLNALANEQPMPADRATQEADVTSYTHLETLAKSYDIPLPPYLASEDTAFLHQQFVLAKYLWDRALAAGQISMTDKAQLRRYYAILYGTGFWYTQDPTNTDLTREGAKHLMTANLLAEKYGLDGAAAARLRDLYSADQSQWPTETVPTPLLDAKGGG